MWGDPLIPAATPELKWERTGPDAPPPLALSPQIPVAVYPEVTSLCTEKEAGHPPPGSQPGSPQWAEAGGERVYGGGGPKAKAAPLASSWQAPVPGDCRCSEG